jgi:hypothetical protein
VTVNDVNEFAVTPPATQTLRPTPSTRTRRRHRGRRDRARRDADATTNVVSYSLTDNAGGKFAIDSARA